MYQVFKKIGDITISFNKFYFFLVDFKILGGILWQVTSLQGGMQSGTTTKYSAALQGVQRTEQFT